MRVGSGLCRTRRVSFRLRDIKRLSYHHQHMPTKQRNKRNQPSPNKQHTQPHHKAYNDASVSSTQTAWNTTRMQGLYRPASTRRVRSDRLICVSHVFGLVYVALGVMAVAVRVMKPPLPSIKEKRWKKETEIQRKEMRPQGGKRRRVRSA
jgi:hypothetical protein